MSRSTAWDVRNRRFFDARGDVQASPLLSRLAVLSLRSNLTKGK